MNPVWKWIAGIAVCVLVLIMAASWYVAHKLKPRITEALTERITEQTDGRYTLTYDRLDISLLTGSASATHLRFSPALLHDTTWRPRASYDIRVDRLQVNGLGVLRWLFTGDFHIRTITVDTPLVRITTHVHTDTADADTAGGAWLTQLSKNKQLADMRVGRFIIRAGELVLVSDHDATRLHTEQINATVRGIQLDSASLNDTARFYGAEAINVAAAAIAYTRPDSLYQWHSGPLRLETAERELVLRDLRYGLTVSKAEFYRQVGLAEDIGDVAIAKVGLSGIELGRWMDTQTIAAAVLNIDSGHIAVYKDKTQYNPPENKIGLSPHQQLLRMEQRVAIDSVLIDAVDIRFTEVSDQTGEAGTVAFDGTAAVIHHLTNDSAELARDRFMRMDARTRVMGTGDLAVDFRFDLLDSLGAHTYQAEVGPMDAAAFNRMLTPQMRVEVEQGTIRRLRFDMEANDRRTTGTLQLDYDGLKVNLLRKDADGGTSPKRIVSFFANRFLLNDSNPDANGIHHMGDVYIERPYSFSFFKMVWRSIREGTKQCIGLGDG